MAGFHCHAIDQRFRLFDCCVLSKGDEWSYAVPFARGDAKSFVGDERFDPPDLEQRAHRLELLAHPGFDGLVSLARASPQLVNQRCRLAWAADLAARSRSGRSFGYPDGAEMAPAAVSRDRSASVPPSAVIISLIIRGVSLMAPRLESADRSFGSRQAQAAPGTR
jgi:hypothetical protein